VRAVMDEMGKAMMGTGEAEGEDRAVQAAEKAIANPLLDEISLRGAKGVLINITGAHDLTLFELDEAANRIREEVDPDANIIVGSTLDTAMEGQMRVSVVATGIDATEIKTEIPVPRRPMSAPLTKSVSVEQARVAEPLELHSPAEQAQPVAAEAAPQEPSLFEGMDVQRAAAQEQAEDIFEEVEETGSDGLPRPAYQPQPVQEFQAQAHAQAEIQSEAPEASFVAPKAPAPGTPSADAIVRLQAAAARAQGHQPVPSAQQPQPRQEEAPAEQRRFGLNSLIHRMTGSAGEGQPGGKAQPVRQQPPVQQQAAAPQPQPAPQQQAEQDQDRIEIPAFLRRQAN